MLVFLKFCTALVAVHIMEQFFSGALHCTADIALPFIYGIYFYCLFDASGSVKYLSLLLFTRWNRGKFFCGALQLYLKGKYF